MWFPGPCRHFVFVLWGWSPRPFPGLHFCQALSQSVLCYEHSSSWGGTLLSLALLFILWQNRVSGFSHVIQSTAPHLPGQLPSFFPAFSPESCYGRGTMQTQWLPIGLWSPSFCLATIYAERVNVFEKKKKCFVKWENFCFKPAQCQKNTPENKKQSDLVLFPD